MNAHRRLDWLLPAAAAAFLAISMAVAAPARGETPRFRWVYGDEVWIDGAVDGDVVVARQDPVRWKIGSRDADRVPRSSVRCLVPGNLSRPFDPTASSGCDGLAWRSIGDRIRGAADSTLLEAEGGGLLLVVRSDRSSGVTYRLAEGSWVPEAERFGGEGTVFLTPGANGRPAATGGGRDLVENGEERTYREAARGSAVMADRKGGLWARAASRAPWTRLTAAPAGKGAWQPIALDARAFDRRVPYALRDGDRLRVAVVDVEAGLLVESRVVERPEGEPPPATLLRAADGRLYALPAEWSVEPDGGRRFYAVEISAAGATVERVKVPAGR